MEKNLEILKEETDKLNEIFGTLAALGLGGLVLYKLSTKLYGPISKAIEEKTAELKERQKTERITRGEATEEIASEVTKEITKFLKSNPGTAKIATTGSFRYRKDSMTKMKNEIDKALSRYPFSPSIKQKIESDILRNLVSSSVEK